jgi:hypothetical protein
MKYIYLLLIFTLPVCLHAQTYRGKVIIAGENGRAEAAAGAAVYWIPSVQGDPVESLVYTNEEGRFSIPVQKGSSGMIAASFMGYIPDTLQVGMGDRDLEFILAESSGTLDEVQVTGRRRGNYISNLSSVKTEVITAAGLCKMACCNLAESFENSASVSVGYSDAVIGARQIRLLGLSGNYTQMLEENRPAMRGIQVPFGLAFVPGQWLESIQIA